MVRVAVDELMGVALVHERQKRLLLLNHIKPMASCDSIN